MFSAVRSELHVFPHLAPVTCFPALSSSYMFSRVWHRLHVFPRLGQVTCFPALGTCCMSCPQTLIGSIRCSPSL